MPNNDTSSRVKSRFSKQDDLVRIQFRVPEHLRDEFNRVAYSELNMQDERASELDRNELQAAAAKLLMENTDLWWETAEAMFLDDDQ